MMLSDKDLIELFLMLRGSDMSHLLSEQMNYWFEKIISKYRTNLELKPSERKKLEQMLLFSFGEVLRQLECERKQRSKEFFKDLLE